MKRIIRIGFVILLVVSCEMPNQAPEIHSVSATPDELVAGERSTFSCVATDSYGDELEYSWTCTGGSFPEGVNAQSVTWEAPDTDGVFLATVIVNDGKVISEESLEVTVFDGGGGDGSFTDPRDGNRYEYKTIGNQTWMIENLAYLPSVSNPDDGSKDDPYYYVSAYEGTNVSSAKASENYETYGVLYNWEAVKTACPDGWHLPSDEEWKTLEKHLGMSTSDANDDGSRGDVGVKLKSTTGWYNGDNSSGFTALPGGNRYLSGGFLGLGAFANFWSSTESGSSYAWIRSLRYGIDGVGRGSYDSRSGISVRCIKDE